MNSTTCKRRWPGLSLKKTRKTRQLTKIPKMEMEMAIGPSSQYLNLEIKNYLKIIFLIGIKFGRENPRV
jgi:hypothetical protein